MYSDASAFSETRWCEAFSNISQPMQSWIIAIILGIYAVLLAWLGWVHSPTLDEVGHLPSGISHWELGRFELYRVNPPLVRMVAALPVMAAGAKTDWSDGYYDTPYGRSEFTFGHKFMKANFAHYFWYFTLSRWALIPFCLIGAWSCCHWATDFYGRGPGLVALVLYCSCPNLMGWGATITPDAAATAMGIWAAYRFWRWIQAPNWVTATWAGITLGVAELTKTTWLLCFVLWPVIACLSSLLGKTDCFRSRSISSVEAVTNGVHQSTAFGAKVPGPHTGKTLAHWGQLFLIIGFGVYLINLGYGFEGTFKPLGTYPFISQTLSGQQRPADGANRFANTWLGGIPVPFPENYVRGIDVQKFDFEKGKWSYLRGEHRFGGWWYYYLYALVVKLPIGTLLLILLGLASSYFACCVRREFQNMLPVILPALGVLIVVSSQTGFNRYLRYAIPALPFLFILASGSLRAGAAYPLARFRIVCFCLSAAVIESFSVYPHSLSFFNQLVGGPLNGRFHLLDANIDWGQDLLFLKQWHDRHPEARPISIAYFGPSGIDPAFAGMESQPVPQWSSSTSPISAWSDLDSKLRPGWFAVSVNYLQGYRDQEHDRPVFTYLQKLTPVARAGYSIYIYHLTQNDCDRLLDEKSNAPKAPL